MGERSIEEQDMENCIEHNFGSCLYESEDPENEPFWDATYRKMFPNLVNHMRCKGNGTATESQKRGIDRIIHLSSGVTLFLDEKLRKPNPRTGRDYSDIALEYISNNTTNSPGWIEKDLAIDYIAYAFKQSRRVHFLPWLLLKQAWREYGQTWLQNAEQRQLNFMIIEAKNDVGYTTLSVAVPTVVLWSAIQRVSVVDIGLAVCCWDEIERQ